MALGDPLYHPTTGLPFYSGDQPRYDSGENCCPGGTGCLNGFCTYGQIKPSVFGTFATYVWSIGLYGWLESSAYGDKELTRWSADAADFDDYITIRATRDCTVAMINAMDLRGGDPVVGPGSSSPVRFYPLVNGSAVLFDSGIAYVAASDLVPNPPSVVAEVTLAAGDTLAFAIATFGDGVWSIPERLAYTDRGSNGILTTVQGVWGTELNPADRAMEFRTCETDKSVNLTGATFASSGTACTPNVGDRFILDKSSDTYYSWTGSQCSKGKDIVAVDLTQAGSTWTITVYSHEGTPDAPVVLWEGSKTGDIAGTYTATGSYTGTATVT
jgi:hypothetical protein